MATKNHDEKQSSDLVVNSDKRTEKLIGKLGALLAEQSKKLWDIGDLLVELVDGHQIKIGTLADRFHWARNRLSEIYQTAKAFPLTERDADLPFYAHEVARSAAKRTKTPTKVSVFTAPEALKEIKREMHKNPRLRNKRGATQLLTRIRDEKRAKAEKAKGIGALVKARTLLNNVYHEDWRLTAARIKESGTKIHLALADPPFGQFHKLKDGHLDMSMSCARTDCDNADGESALATTLPLFELLPPIMAPNSALLLWQMGGYPIRPQILEAAAQNGWDSRIVEAYWIKGRIGAEGQLITKPKPEDFEFPFTTSSEKLAVFYLKGSPPFNHDGSSRIEFMVYAPVSQSMNERDAHHVWEKPLDLSEFLIKKFTDEGQNIFEPFGCSGAFSRAAALLGRNFVYSESNAENYDWGSPKVMGTHLSVQKAA